MDWIEHIKTNRSISIAFITVIEQLGRRKVKRRGVKRRVIIILNLIAALEKPMLKSLIFVAKTVKARYVKNYLLQCQQHQILFAANTLIFCGSIPKVFSVSLWWHYHSKFPAFCSHLQNFRFFSVDKSLNIKV